MIAINGREVHAKEFAFDGCHKIYLINTPQDKKIFTEYGYGFLPIEDLPEVWENSCSLRFISDADLKKSQVLQFQEARIKELV